MRGGKKKKKVILFAKTRRFANPKNDFLRVHKKKKKKKENILIFNRMETFQINVSTLNSIGPIPFDAFCAKRVATIGQLKAVLFGVVHETNVTEIRLLNHPSAVEIPSSVQKWHCIGDASWNQVCHVRYT
ncbi:hypothetical protein RFI_28138 [Reticulomyxa filosa]|uniref:Uncharacterized protein n=1 Tax=Reticulomyxa filosa TaxID=46433 RepID=X6M899_RETFI|nr:hypothetical protein RFI_28138 [Reticulomyxa filosa]|eukprot:ETO09250.1 hypothetical protein RFI_28138 [Reticulomyxa filosa]